MLLGDISPGEPVIFRFERGKLAALHGLTIISMVQSTYVEEVTLTSSTPMPVEVRINELRSGAININMQMTYVCSLADEGKVSEYVRSKLRVVGNCRFCNAEGYRPLDRTFRVPMRSPGSAPKLGVGGSLELCRGLCQENYVKQEALQGVEVSIVGSSELTKTPD